ncbi:MAG: hypothetical protein AAF653_16875 [Chloroflexota bacterium]
MMTRNKIAEDRLEQMEVNSMAWHTMIRIARGETLMTGGIYLRMALRLNERAIELEREPELHPQDKNDWLALALFAEDRARFLAACKQAQQNKSYVYLQVQPWLQQIIYADEVFLGRTGGQ